MMQNETNPNEIVQNEPAERTFTQVEVDRIVSERLKRERDRFAAEAQQREADFARREALLNAKEDWSMRGLPVALLDHIDLSKDGAIEAVTAILEGIKPNRVGSRAGIAPTPMFQTDERANDLRGAFGLR